ncbi:MAG: UDP-N-acetylmuramoyl-tripeptide--D-alanyl-D-alanine ligase [Chitinophagales bacterium]|nr:UDP-N-acetylmuramoyl-tripeptide--D-alanyl-D-alanine ligase [Chitinophagales bacterium]
MTSREQLFALYKKSSGVVIDSRKVEFNSIFFALKGEHTNGNEYAVSAINKGALCVVTDNAEYAVNDSYLLVSNVLIALQDLARDYRDTLSIPVIGLTGSNGKTTSKELLHAVLSKKYKCFATYGNLNNHLGVPISILSIPKDAEIAVIEMGANHQKEIEFLCTIAKPTHGLITNIGKAHLEGFGGIEGVKIGKSELHTYLRMHQGIIFMNSVNTMLSDTIADYPNVIYFGNKPTDTIKGIEINDSPFATVIIDDIKITSQLIGGFNAHNILAAVCIGKYFNVHIQEIKSAIESYQPDNNRSQWKQSGTNFLYLDAYNANPSSMQSAILHFLKMQVQPKILIMGDMLELGEYSAEEHNQILELAIQSGFQTIVAVGAEFKKIKKEGVLYFDNADVAKSWFEKQNFQSTYFLIKGSRGIRLEKIIA